MIDSDELTSDHVAFNLLMARLRLQLYSQVNPLAKEEAAQRIHDFIDQNQRLMRKEYNILLEHSQAA